ncbi:IPP transferase-domain-containing protein [Kockovaella imperatae]|uniref:IPP transferase-domain-containing protein n=1 Tax=Kockovaella imperatae TaxID=4999 RepID=A0A1Y1UCL8_9TREE|nr:IPP transferase-domain-containing protein [Kockovaella imperatae]ORX35790.1 IPP transferase-domain-containing protein [Kockovaella imperatae]
MTLVLRRQFATLMSTAHRASTSVTSSSAAGSAQRLRDIVCVCGTTGVGKSQLAVALGQSIQNGGSSDAGPSRSKRAVILSADSMQLYKGLDVITNKVTVEEQGGIEHWGLDVVTPGQEASWELGRWCSEAEKKISSLDDSTLPIICGGTHYFMQHFLFPPAELSLARSEPPEKALEIRWKPPCPRPAVPDLMDPSLVTLLDTFWTTKPVFPKLADSVIDPPDQKDRPVQTSRPTEIEDHHLLSIYQVLQAVDPDEAARWHWRDGRKVRRALERWWERGGAPAVGTPDNVGRNARFRTLIFWVYEPPETLKKRLDDRVDVMVENGLLREIAEMREIAKQMFGSSQAVDHTEGVFQAIGYKEFAGLPLDETSDPASHPLFSSMLSQTKSKTFQYAKSQLKWIRKQLLPVVQESQAKGSEVFLYIVPGGPAGQEMATPILHAFLDTRELPEALSTGSPHAKSLLGNGMQSDLLRPNVPNTAERQRIHARRDCEQCSSPGLPVSVPVKEWSMHLTSRQHKKAIFEASGGRERVRQEQLANREAKRAERARLREGLVPPEGQKGDQSA